MVKVGPPSPEVQTILGNVYAFLEGYCAMVIISKVAKSDVLAETKFANGKCACFIRQPVGYI